MKFRQLLPYLNHSLEDVPDGRNFFYKSSLNEKYPNKHPYCTG